MSGTNPTDSITGAIIRAVREELNRSISAEETRSPNVPSHVQGSLYHRVSTISSNSHHGESSSASVSGPVTQNVPLESNTSYSERKRPKFTLPSMFQSKVKHSKKDEPKTKSVKYLRDIFCLPHQSCKMGSIHIPRGTRRSALANKDIGLMGKIEFQSDWCADKMRKEVCSVFVKPFALTQQDIDNGDIFPFEYLQRTGAGSRTLCVPTVSPSFEWNGRQVATLAKSGGIIYIMATRDIPVILKLDHDSSDESASACSPAPSSPSADVWSSSPFQETPPYSELQPDFGQQEGRQQDPIIVVDSDDNPGGTGLSCSIDIQTSSIKDTGPLAQPFQIPRITDPQTSPVKDLYSSESSLSGIDSTDTPQSLNPLEKLSSVFDGSLDNKQVEAVYLASGKNFDASMECLLEGPTTTSLLSMMNALFRPFSVIKIQVDPDDIWQDMVVQYKSPRMDLMKCLRIKLEGQPALDTGGVRRLVYTTIYMDFMSNKFVKLFDGPSHSRRPLCTAESRSSGLFKVLGMMVAHSICQDGIGFPYFSPTSYWYIIGGDERAMEFASVEDIGADVASVVSQLKSAKSAEDLQVLYTEDITDVFQRCGITAALTVSSKEMIAQDLIAHEAIYKPSKLLDQFAEGLKKLPVYDLMERFPEQFLPLFTYTGNITADDVVDALYVHKDTEMQPDDELTMKFLKRYLFQCDQEEMRAFLVHVTGKFVTVKRSIEVLFMDGDDTGAITAHTCTNQITFPQGVFSADTDESYRTFCDAMKSVVSQPLSFNIV